MPLFSENKMMNIIIQIIFCVFICFSTISIISDNQLIFDITKILFIVVAACTCFKATKDVFNDIKK